MSITPKRLDKYELRERLGHGGVAEVWKAFDTQLQRYVAIKLLHPNLRDDPNFVTRFQREAQLIASLHHPNIVQIHDFHVMQPEESKGGSDTSLAYMVMEYVEGQTLADYLHQTSHKGQIPSPAEIVNLFTSISQAVDYAHRQGMIHRDIKPANILLDRGNTTRNPMGEPILSDFGVAKMLSASSNTLSGAQLGTPLYISPEQARGYPGNERSDIYSLGVILYEIVTGVTPFRGDTQIDVIMQHINATPPSPALINPAIPPTLTMVIMRSLAKDPGQRFSSASALAAAIAEALNLPVPEILGQPTYPLDAPEMPTLLTPPPSTQPQMATHDGATRTDGHAGPPPVPSNPNSTPNFTPNLTPVQLSATPSSSNAPPAYPTPLPPVATPMPLQPPPSSRRRRWNALYIALTALLILVIIGGLFGGYLLFFKQPLAPASAVVGHAFYVSSGQLDPGSAQGIADQMEIDLQNVPAPQAGKSYYVWLLGDKNPETQADLTGPRPVKPPILLTNNLPVRNGSVHFFFGGDAQHNNLLSTTSRLLIAEEPAGQRPAAPPTDRSTWRYYAEIPQAQIAGQAPGFSALLHIRHLFYNETNIEVLGLPGGLDIWLFRNTEKVLEWAVSARDDWHGASTSPGNLALMNAQFIRILDYLDGAQNVQVDVPPGTPLMTDPVISRVALLTVNPKVQVPANFKNDPFGYVDHVQLHVAQVAQAPDATPEMRQTAGRILGDVNRAKAWLTEVHKDALQLFQMRNNPAQLMQPSTGALLDDLVTQATFAYIGQLNPVTNQVEGGVLQAHYDTQQLAALTITRNLPQSL